MATGQHHAMSRPFQPVTHTAISECFQIRFPRLQMCKADKELVLKAIEKNVVSPNLFMLFQVPTFFAAADVMVNLLRYHLHLKREMGNSVKLGE